MALYRVYRLKESVRQQFRWAPHTIGISRVKQKDYEVVNTVEAPNVYAAWMALKDTENALQLGDLLEGEANELRICKYVGFEQAEWFVPEPKPGAESAPPATPEAPEAVAP